ncbi:MAG: NAD(P)-dependent oxidoreductase [Chloroflexi bacterium]|nr:MAG: NAD(P)-dependent oxidoreductase [Chloroflexota bacterium]
MKQKIVITGGCGKIGTYFARFAADKYFIRIVDRTAWNHDKHGIFPGECMVADLQNLSECQKACADMDVVIHLAANADPEADFHSSLLGNNIIATHNMFRAAKDAGCKRFIYASSAHVVSGYARDIQVGGETAVFPKNEYGVSKCFGEALAAYFANSEGLPSIILRIGAYIFPREYDHFSRDELNAFLDPDDFNELLIKCIETPNINYFIAHAISDNRYKRLDLTETREKLGFHPKADAFKIFK